MGFFGGALSENVALTSTQLLLNIVNSSVESCTSTTSGTQVTAIIAAGNSTITIDSLRSEQIVTINTDCLLSNSSTTCLSTQLNQQANQVAEAISAEFGLDTSQSDNISTLLDNLSETVFNTYTAQCVNTIIANQYNIVVAVGGGTVVAGTLDFDQVLQSSNDCIMSNENVVSIQNQISQAIQQQADSKTQSLLTTLLITIVVIMILVVIAIIAIPLILGAVGIGGAAVLGGSKAASSIAKSNVPPPTTQTMSTYAGKTSPAPSRGKASVPKASGVLPSAVSSGVKYAYNNPQLAAALLV